MSTDKKVLFVFPRPAGVHGRGFITTIERLRQQYEVTVACFGVKEKLSGVAYYRLTYANKDSLLGRFMRKNKYGMPLLHLIFIVFRINPDLIYVREPALLPTVLLLKYIFRKPKYLIDLRENPDALYPTRVNLLKHAGDKFDGAVTNSPKLAEILKEEYGFTDVALHYTFPSQKFLHNVLLGMKRKADSGLSLCFFGDIKSDRKLEIAVGGVNRIENPLVSLDIYGRIKDADYQEYLKQLDLANRVSFCGMIAYDTAPKTLCRYDVGVLLNEIDENSKITIPGKLWEYTSCGLCLISNRRPSIIQWIEAHQLGLIADNEIEFAECVELLCDDQEMLRKYSRHSREFFEMMYSTGEQQASHLQDMKCT